MIQTKAVYPEKNTILLQVTDKLYHIVVYQVQITGAGFELITLVVIGTDDISCCKFLYHAITTTTVPLRPRSK